MWFNVIKKSDAMPKIELYTSEAVAAGVLMDEVHEKAGEIANRIRNEVIVYQMHTRQYEDLKGKYLADTAISGTFTTVIHRMLTRKVIASLNTKKESISQ